VNEVFSQFFRFQLHGFPQSQHEKTQWLVYLEALGHIYHWKNKNTTKHNNLDIFTSEYEIFDNMQHVATVVYDFKLQ
jgi:hypothetical protein